MFFRPIPKTAPSHPAREPDALAEQVERAQAGDTAALRRVLERVGPEVARVARTMLGPTAPQLDDVVQETLLAFVKALGSFRAECSVRRFAHRIAVRTALHERRRQRRAMASNAPLLDDPHDRDQTRAPDALTLAARRQRLLVELLATLPVAQAEALALRVVLGMSLLEVANATNVPENTVRSRLRLARESLRQRIEAEPRLHELLGGEP